MEVPQRNRHRLWSLIMVAACMLSTVSGAINQVDIVTEVKFTNTDYYLLMAAFKDGMKLEQKYSEFKNCFNYGSQMLDDFFVLNVNRTETDVSLENYWEGQTLNVTQIVSTSYKDTLNYCFLFLKQVQRKSVIDNNKFVDDEDRFTSFLFNLLGNSLSIRQNSENLVLYSESEDWILYSKSLGTIIQDLVYFNSEASGALEIDNDSPYLINSDGVLLRKDEAREIIGQLHKAFGGYLPERRQP